MSKKLICLVLVLGFGLIAGVTDASEIKINFQSSGAPIPEGYLPEYGDPFVEHDNGWSYGWDQNIRSGARDRNSGNAPDQRYDTLNHLQQAGGDKIWEIELPNGTYNLFLVCGDPEYGDQTNNFDVEGVLLTDPNPPPPEPAFDFDEFNVTVEVTDGRLTIQPGAGADNCKICFVDIESDALTQFFQTARDPNPADGTEGVVDAILTWTPGDTSVVQHVYFSTNPDDLIQVSKQAYTVYWHPEPMEPGTTYYWRIDGEEADGTIITGDIWSFVSLSLNAWGPNPADGDKDVMIDAQLSWSEGDSILPLKHHVFFGTDETAVAEGTGDTDKGILEEAAYDPGLLNADTTYYFRVNEVDLLGEVREGDLWSFKTVEPGPGKVIREWWFNMSGSAVSNLEGNDRYPNDPDGSEFVSYFQGPEDWAEQYGSRLRGWLFVPETGDYTFLIEAEDQGEIHLSPDEDPANAVTIADTEAEAESQPQSLEAGKRYYIEALMKHDTIGDSIVVSWQGPGIGTMKVISADYVGATPYLAEKAYASIPADGASDISQTAILSWSPGVNAASHQLYFGTDADAVKNSDTSSPEYKGTRQLGSESYDPGKLEWFTTYYWRVDEVEDGGTIQKGNVWSFTTANFIIVDDMESYNDLDPTDPDSNRIFNVWIDGFTDPANGGSEVGYFTVPFTEQTIVHGGSQSMPFAYDNATGKSEATLPLTDTRDWTENGVSTLVIWYIGDAANAAETMYVVLNDSAGVDNPDANAAQVTAWTEWTIDLQAFADQGVSLTNVNTITLG
ncbi:MAG: PA14 domain-containing protein, partial [Planctomycetota bacterium]